MKIRPPVRFRLCHLPLLVIAASAVCVAAQGVIMPQEIGVSCLKRKPFTAMARTTLSRVFPSGTTRTVTVEDRIARDADGRVLREQHSPWTEDPAHPIYYINILDPVSMQNIHLDPQKHLATTSPVDQKHAWDYVPYDGTQYRLVANPPVTVSTELLGHQQIAGLHCWGQRTTYLYPPGSFQGNTQPVTRTWEVWHANDLGADVRIVAHSPDPTAGDQQTDLTGITYAAPDPSIFAPPAGYTIQQRPK